MISHNTDRGGPVHGRYFLTSFLFHVRLGVLHRPEQKLEKYEHIVLASIRCSVLSSLRGFALQSDDGKKQHRQTCVVDAASSSSSFARWRKRRTLVHKIVLRHYIKIKSFHCQWRSEQRSIYKCGAVFDTNFGPGRSPLLPYDAIRTPRLVVLMASCPEQELSSC